MRGLGCGRECRGRDEGRSETEWRACPGARVLCTFRAVSRAFFAGTSRWRSSRAPPAWSRDSLATSAGVVCAAATARPVPDGTGKRKPSSTDRAITTAAMPSADRQRVRAGPRACRPERLSDGWFKKVPGARHAGGPARDILNENTYQVQTRLALVWLVQVSAHCLRRLWYTPVSWTRAACSGTSAVRRRMDRSSSNISRR